MKKIKYLFVDIDGVLTDGTVSLDEQGNERKSICYRDLDAIGMGRSVGLDFAFVTGEDTDLARSIARRFGVKHAVFGAKDKGKAVKELLQELQVDPEDICYIGDSLRDVPAIRMAGLGAAPRDAMEAARQAADFVAQTFGGKGVLLELVEKIIKSNTELNK